MAFLKNFRKKRENVNKNISRKKLFLSIETD